jgi:hypothetical protein
MSTKIYNAYKVHGMTMEQLFKYLVRLRKRYHKDCVKVVQHTFKPTDPAKSVLFYEVQQALETIMKTGANVVGNFQASAMVFLLDGNIYVKFFGIHDVDKYLNKKYFEDFHYQNSTDKPDHISDKEWRHRCRTWDKIFSVDRFSVFSNCGFVFPIFEERHCFEVAYTAFNKDK